MKQIPVVRDKDGLVRPSFSVTVALAGTNYTLGFHWNARAAAWFCDITLTGVGVAALGLPVRSGALLWSFLRAGMPDGLMVVADRSPTKEDPGRYDLGDRVRLIFIESSEM